jgi:hypothetical protein
VSRVTCQRRPDGLQTKVDKALLLGWQQFGILGWHTLRNRRLHNRVHGLVLSEHFELAGDDEYGGLVVRAIESGPHY